MIVELTDFEIISNRVCLLNYMYHRNKLIDSGDRLQLSIGTSGEYIVSIANANGNLYTILISEDKTHMLQLLDSQYSLLHRVNKVKEGKMLNSGGIEQLLTRKTNKVISHINKFKYLK